MRLVRLRRRPAAGSLQGRLKNAGTWRGLFEPGACLKIAFCQMCVPLCGRFAPNECGVVGYAKRIWGKYTAKWGVQMAGMNFQTRSSCQMCVPLCGRFAPNECGVVGYAKRIWGKYTAKWGVQMAGMNFQTRSSVRCVFDERKRALQKILSQTRLRHKRQGSPPHPQGVLPRHP